MRREVIVPSLGGDDMRVGEALGLQPAWSPPDAKAIADAAPAAVAERVGSVGATTVRLRLVTQC